MAAFLSYILLVAVGATSIGIGICTLSAVKIGFGTIILPIGAAMLIKSYRYNDNKIRFLFEAIKNDDMSIKFHDNGQHRSVNRYLNEIKSILAAEKNKTASKERYYEMILNSIKSGVIVVDDRGMVYQHNKRALQLFDIEVLTHINQLSRLSDNLPALMREMMSGDRQQISVSGVNDVSNLLLELSVIKIHNENMRLFVINDIGRELNEREVIAWQKLIRVLIHEIMNALTPITSISQTLLSIDKPLPDDIRNALNSINITSHGLIRFVESYRAITHRPDPNPIIFYVHPFLERMVAFAKTKSENVDISIGCCDCDLMLYADESLIGQVVTNLINNAIDATEGITRGKITLSAYCDDGDHVYIEVANNGNKISAELAEQIFVPFFTTRTDGNGVGLSVSRQIMSASGGTLTLLPYTHQQNNTVFRLKFD